ncbi:MAG: cytochrome c biogenesis protein CcsA, partial [Muribaculaceae bacterium]
SATALILHRFTRSSHQWVSQSAFAGRIMLYPAVFLLTAGIFIGAVWANVSWGRYWGWDPKEVWALITMLIYATALHSRSLRCYDRPVFFHWFALLAFLSVLFTYFGVNYFLGGLHSYGAA